MTLKIIKTKDYKVLNEVMKEVGGETHGHEKNEIGWIVTKGEKYVGVIGLRHLKSNYAIIDAGPSVSKNLNKKMQSVILKKLINLATKHAKKHTNTLYTHNADEMIPILVQRYGFTICQQEIPDKEYSHPCLECNYRNKDCFPKLLKKELN